MSHAEQVANGVELLTQHFGNDEWRARIVRSELNIADYYLCVLGQLFGGYNYGVHELGLTTWSMVIECGFDVESLDDVDDLTAAWLEAL